MMEKYKKIAFVCLTAIILNSCNNQNPNLNTSGKDELKSLEIGDPIDNDQIHFDDIIYVPIYSDIYIDHAHQRNLLTATLSIRNTSYNDSLFISKIDYFNTEGDLVRSYIDNSISLRPMETVNYVIEREDVTGGSGANFIVEITAKNSAIKPLIQAIMIGQYDNKGFAFATDGYSIKK